MEKLGFTIDFTNLKKWKVVDKNGMKAGKVIDFAINKDYNLTKFVLGGSFFEELSEKMKIKPDDDPVVSLADINSVDVDKKLIKLSISTDDFISKLEKSSFDAGEITFSELSKRRIKGSCGTTIGTPVDALIDIENKTSIIIGENRFIEFMEKIGLTGNYDLLLPSKYVENMNDEIIQISKTKEELKILLNNAEVKNKSIVDYSQLKKDKVSSEIQRYTRYG
ncbi:MAG: hypothetical protein INQ03_00975 [Candidatus Heimdallarchaeota archaeon]|nr:hypothetical protein [Candidatus Heimdallarchaeota archaeon]